MDNSDDPIIVETATVGCDGGTMGHPLVYLHLGKDGETECPYCGRRFVLAEGAKPGSSH